MSDSIDILKRLALLIRNATMDGENTAERVGRTLVGIIEHLNDVSLDELYKIFLRKDIDDTAHGVILFEKKIGSSEYIEGWDGIGWEVESGGAAEFDSLRVRHDIFLGDRIGSASFVSGFPNGTGWQIGVYEKVNAAGVSEKKYKLEIDDVSVRGSLRAYEFIISQMRGEDDNYIFAGMMKVDHYDPETRRIYLDTEEGILYNPFRPGDIIMVQRYGGMPTEDNDYNIIKQYELRVDETGIGSLSDGRSRLDWITFTNFTGDLDDIVQGDILVRVDSVSDSTRKGVVTVTTINETGAPYIDVVYGMKTDPENATKARMGNLTGIRTKNGVDLTGVWGIYGNGAYFENTTIVLDNGNTVEQQFSVLNGRLESIITEIDSDMSLEDGNILVNSSFSKNTDYWVTDNEVSLYSLDGAFLWDGDTFMSEKGDVADIYQDGSRYVLRIRNSSIKQLNSVMDIPVHSDTEEEDEEYTYSFSLYYRALSSGTLSVGMEGTELYLSQQVEPSEEYARMYKSGVWNEEGDFVISCTGEVLIYAVSLFTDELANAVIRLQTQITQNAEAIKLAATKEYVDSETGALYETFQSELSVQAGKITANTTAIDNINDTIETAGWITTAEGNTLYAAKSLENGNNIVSYINQSATSIKISASRVNLTGAVTFSMFNSSLQTTINNKLESSDMGDLAFKDSVSSGDLSYSLSQQIANAIDLDELNSRLNGYAEKGDITYSDLASALQDAIDGKLDGSTTTSAGKLASVIINGKTLIAGGYIQADYINVDDLVATNIEANTGKIGAFNIDSRGLYNNATTPTAYISIEYSGSKFFKLNSDSSAMVSVRSRANESALYIQSYGNNARGIYVMSQAGTNTLAIDSSGSCIFRQRAGETWNVPGVLWAAQYTWSGSRLTKTTEWGNGLADYPIVVTGSGGQYTLTHYLGHTQYIPFVIVYNTSSNVHYIATIKSKYSNDFTFHINDLENRGKDSGFMVMMVGRNKWGD
ncbi:hypothetical protein [Phocaeicola salanitronis]|uniref:hypothetical protein n=1 Tax=Phocaeicola salanitronis TaxID=376805 RepID=UPI0023F832F3|nr:hypothetical protein [Phocaeicola salanitronis]